MREKLRHAYLRKYPEAISRLDALWHAGEAPRLDSTFGMSTRWRDHADHHLRMLVSPDGPFAASRSHNGESESLLFNAPPGGMFVGIRSTTS